MILKYIEFYISNKFKHYSFTSRDIEFDKSQNSIVLPHDYIMKDINKQIDLEFCPFCYEQLITRNLYSSYGNIKRAINTGVLDASFSITYCNNIDKSNIDYYNNSNKAKCLKDLDKYCSAIRYYYFFKDKSILRTEIYGDIVLGDEFEREESYYDKFK